MKAPSWAEGNDLVSENRLNAQVENLGRIADALELLTCGQKLLKDENIELKSAYNLFKSLYESEKEQTDKDKKNMRKLRATNKVLQTKIENLKNGK